jgi:hypothetical protein
MTHESNGHEVSLAQMQRSPKPILIFLATGKNQLSRLLDKTSLRRPSHQESPPHPHATRRHHSIGHIEAPHYHTTASKQLCSPSSLKNLHPTTPK